MAFNTSTNLNQSLTSPQSAAAKGIYTLVLTVVMLLIVFGNIIVLVVLYHQRKRPSLRVTNLFLANLAVVDLSVGLLLFPMSIFTVLRDGWVFGQSLCELNGFINMASGTTSILTLAAISLDRYLAIVVGNKLQYKQALVLLGVVWFWGTLIGLLPVLGWNNYSYGGYGSICKMSFEHDKGYILLTAITCFVLPLITMIYCYLRVFFRVRSHRKLMQQWRGNQSSKKNRNMSSEMRTAKIVVTVLFVFAGAWTPFVIVHLVELSPHIHIPASIFTLVTLFAAMHSFCNPIIYTSMNRKFRADLLELIPVLKKLTRCCSVFCCCCCKKTRNEVNEFALEPSRTGFGDVTSQLDPYAGSIVVVQGERTGKETAKEDEVITITNISENHSDNNSKATKAFLNEAYQI